MKFYSTNMSDYLKACGENLICILYFSLLELLQPHFETKSIVGPKDFNPLRYTTILRRCAEKLSA